MALFLKIANKEDADAEGKYIQCTYLLENKAFFMHLHTSSAGAHSVKATVAHVYKKIAVSSGRFGLTTIWSDLASRKRAG
jgi:hypothetical protein